MIIGVIGDRGSGKTLFMTKEAFFCYLNNKQVYSNYRLNFKSNENKLKPKLIKNDFFRNFEKYNLKNVSLFLDEIYVYIDSRNSGSSINKIMSYFFNQTRKTGVDLYYSTQFFSQVDKRLRFNTEKFVTPKIIKDKNKNSYLLVKICNRDLKILNEYIIKCSALFNAKLYDTDEIVRFNKEKINKKKNF